MAQKKTPEEPMDPVTRVVMMAQAGQVTQITSSMLREAAAYSLKQEQVNAQKNIEGDEKSES